MKLTYLGVFALSTVALPAAGHRVASIQDVQSSHVSESSDLVDGLYCNDRIANTIKPRMKKGIIVKMKPFILQKSIKSNVH